MNFKKWVKSIKTVGYNGAHTVYIVNRNNYKLIRKKFDTILGNKGRNFTTELTLVYTSYSFFQYLGISL